MSYCGEMCARGDEIRYSPEHHVVDLQNYR
jgi:hypothetical protein